MEINELFTQDDFVNSRGEYVNPMMAHEIAQAKFEKWIYKQFTGERVWIPKGDLIKGVEVKSKVYTLESSKVLPENSQFVELWPITPK